MAELVLGDPSHLHIAGSETANAARGKWEEPDHSIFHWYFSKEDIEKNSPSRKDGIDLMQEMYFRKSYCAFLQDLGMRLKVPQVTIATAIIFCHRFFHRQSHAKNDRYTIAMVCMFLAGKVEETPRLLRDVILVSCEIRSKKDPAAMQRIKLREVYEQEKELVLLGENVVLVNLGFDLNVRHPYKPLVAAIKKFKVAQNALAQVAWNFVNDGLRTSLCLQYEPHHIAAGAIFLAAKFLKVKLPSDGQVVWWQEFGVAPQQLEDVSNQLLELYEQSRAASVSHQNEPTASSCVNYREKLGSLQANSETTQCANGHSQFREPAVAQTGYGASRPGGAGQATKRNGSKDVGSSHKYFCSSLNGRNDSTQDRALSANSRCTGKSIETAEQINPNKERPSDESTLSTSHVNERNDAVDSRMGLDERRGSKFSNNVLGDETRDRIQSDCSEQKLSYVSIGDVNKDKPAMEKTGKSCGEGIKTKPNMLKADLIDGDEDALIEIELESGMKAPAKAEKAKHERKESWRKYYTSKLEGSKSKNECIDEGGNGVKRKQFNDENMPEKRRESSFEQATLPDQDQQKVPEEALNDQPEEGELPNSPVSKSACSPKFYDRRSQVGDHLENGRRSTNWREYEGCNQHRHRDGSYNNKKWHNYHRHRYSSNHQHRADADRYEHRSKYRDWHKYNHKRRRHEY